MQNIHKNSFPSSKKSIFCLVFPFVLSYKSLYANTCFMTFLSNQELNVRKDFKHCNTMELPVQFDNINRRVVDDLKEKLTAASSLSVAAASFSIYAFEALKKELEAVHELRFIFTSPAFNKETAKKQQREFYIPKLNRERNLYGSEFEIRLRNQLSQKAIARECAEWIRRKVHFKSNVSGGVMNGFMNVTDGKGNDYTYFPFNEFTTTELGIERGNNLCPGIMRLPSPYAEQYIRNFDELWHDKDRFQDVTDTVIENIETVYRENAPEFIYFVTLYNIFHEFLEDISEDVLPNEATGFKNSEIWGKLYNFQRDAALAIINKLEKYNGCILADSVGLGKTFTALAVIKYYENRNKSVLVLCPKKLNDNWITYRSNYVNNPIARDRLRYDILFHTDLSRNTGKTNGLDLSHINWGNYDLVVIDESHNFRNGGKVTTDEDDNPKENRYLRLMNRVMRQGVRTKVLMLSATPVNNRFNDLKNQLQLAYEGDASNIDGLLGTKNSIDDIFRQAQTVYNRWSKLPAEERTTKALQDALSFDFFEVLDAVTIARSRKHIEQYYDTADIGKFPNRLSPLSRRPKLTDLDNAVTYNEIYRLIQKLNLAIYTPSDFILPSKRYKYITGKESDKDFYAGLSMSGRERGIRRLMCINLLKRLESSVASFRLTVERVREQVNVVLEKIGKADLSNTTVDGDLTPDGLDMDDSESDVFIGNKKGKVCLADMDYISWSGYLEKDLKTLGLLLQRISAITPAHDGKLAQLKADLQEKFTHPINGNNKKVIIFTAFSDTAVYLYDNLATYIKEQFNLDTALVTGDVEARSTLKLKARQKLDFNTVLTLFSPISKEKVAIFPDTDGEIDVLIATDCISEGQNLQDCDYLVNFDIHWNPVRIIQRFGRIDRIGSRNAVIQMVNYWPDVSLDEYINLKARVEARMKVSVLTATGDDNPLTTEEQNDLDYRKEQLQRLQHEVIDLEDMNTGVSIMDLGLNEFRLDLLAYMKDNPDVEHTPNGLHAVTRSRKDTPEGVIFVLKSRKDSLPLDVKNRLHPFYMVYIGMDGNVVINHLSPKDLLDRFRSLCKGKAEPDKDLCHIFNKETRDGADMSRYSKLLNQAVVSIVQTKEVSDMESFLTGAQTTLFTGRKVEPDDFELIDFLVVRKEDGVC